MSNALQLTQSALAAPPDLKGVFEIDAFKFNCVSNYEKTTGRKDGELVFESERLLFMKAVKDNPKLEKCSRFSIYSAFVELFVSGLSLLEGMSYIIPYKDTAQFQIGWKGRLEQMSRMPEVRVVHEPQFVLTNELNDFEYQLGEEVKILKHKPAKDRTITKENKIEFVYVVIDTAFGKRAYVMTRQEVLNIRDTYSIPYKYYIARGGKWDDGKPMDPPFWITNEAEAFKKTVVKRAYKYTPKTPRQKLLDEKIGTYIDHEDGTAESNQAAIDYGIALDQSGAETGSQGAKEISQGDNSPGGGGNKPGSESGGQDVGNGSGNQKANEPEKTKRSHKKKAPAETKAQEPETKTAVTENGTKYDTETAEEVTDGPSDDNPAADLPDLGNLKTF